MILNSTAHLYRIGEFAKKVGKTSRALRFYEKLGLIFPQGRTDAGYRLYGEDAFLQVYWIDLFQNLGFSLTEIKSFLEGLDQAQNRPTKMNQIREFYEERLAETRAQIDKLQALETQLISSLSTLGPCARCDTGAAEHNCLSCLDRTLKEQKRDTMPLALNPLITRILQNP